MTVTIPTPILIALPILLIVAVVWLVRRSDAARRRRVAALRGLASDLGGRFSTTRDFNTPASYRRTTLFTPSLGDYRQNTITLERPTDRAVRLEAGDYVRLVGEDRRRLGYALVHTTLGDLPRTVARPEHAADRAVAGAALANDIDFESAEFSRRYHVSADDRRTAYALFDPRVIQTLLDDPDTPTVEFDADRLLVHFHLSTRHNLQGAAEGMPPERLRALIDLALAVLDALPEHLKAGPDGAAR